MAAPVLKFKRGAFADLPTLAVGEPGFTTDRYQLFVGSPNGNKIIGGGDFWNENSTTEGGGIRLYEGTNNGDDFVELKAPDSVGTSITFTLPGTDGSANQVLQTNGSGVLTFGELNVSAIDIDGATDIGAAIADDDLFIVDDGGGGTNRKTAASRLKTYVLGGSAGATFDTVTVGSAVTITSDGIDAGASGIITAGGGFVGDLTGNVTGNVTGDLTGTATTATSANTIKTVNTPVVNANHYITFVDSDNSTATAETLKTDAGIYYNPFLNQFNANGVNAGVLSLNSVDVTSTAAELNILDGVTATTADINLLGDLGTFTGTTISDNTGIKTALQELETELELIGAGGAQAASIAVGATDTDSSFFLTFVPDNNASPTQEELKTDAGVSYNPSTNIMTVGEVSVTTLDIGGTNVTATATELNVLDGVTAFLDEDNLGSDSATAIPSQQSVKAYVDSSVAGVAVTFLLDADSGTADVFQTGQTLTFSGTANEVDTAVSDNTITIGLPNAVVVGTSLSAPTVKTGVIQAGDGTASQTIANSTGKVTTSAAHEVQGTFTAAGLADLQGNVDIGNATSDTVTVTGRFDSGLVPSTDNTRDLGSSALSWKEGHINALEGTQANLSGVATASEFKGTTLTITGGGSFGGNVSITGNLSVGGSVTSIDVEDLRIVSPVVELGLERLPDGTLQPPANETTYNSGVVMYYNHVGINSTNAKIAAMFAKIKKGGDMRIGFATDVEITTVGAGDSVASINAWADIEARGLYITDCAGTSQVISCSGSTRLLENITIDGGAFS